MQDLEYALRVLRKSPGFTATAVITLGFGIGVNTSIFTLFNAIAIRPLSVKDADQVVRVYQHVKTESSRSIHGSVWMASNYEYETYRGLRSLSGLAAYAEASVTLVVGKSAETEPAHAQLVSENYFALLSNTMARGRPILVGDRAVAILSHNCWQQRFGGDPTVLGQTITLNREHFTVVGVAAKEFGGADAEMPDLWVPMIMQPAITPGENLAAKPTEAWLYLVGRLKPGFSIRQAQAEIAILARQLDLTVKDQTTTVILRGPDSSRTPMAIPFSSRFRRW